MSTGAFAGFIGSLRSHAAQLLGAAATRSNPGGGTMRADNVSSSRTARPGAQAGAPSDLVRSAPDAVRTTAATMMNRHVRAGEAEQEIRRPMQSHPSRRPRHDLRGAAMVAERQTIGRPWFSGSMRLRGKQG